MPRIIFINKELNAKNKNLLVGDIYQTINNTGSMFIVLQLTATRQNSPVLGKHQKSDNIGNFIKSKHFVMKIFLRQNQSQCRTADLTLANAYTMNKTSYQVNHTYTRAFILQHFAAFVIKHKNNSINQKM